MALSDAVDNVRSTLSAMTERERRGLSIAAIVALFMFVGVPLYLANNKLGEIEEENQEVLAVIEEFNQSRDQLQKIKSERQAIERLYAKPSPALGTFIEQQAQTKGLTGLKVTDQPRVAMGAYTRRSIRANIAQASLRPFLEMLADIKNSGHPVAISSIRIERPRLGETYSVNLTVNAYDKKAVPAPAEGEK